MHRTARRGVLRLRRGTIAEGLVRAVGVKPDDPFDDREFELGLGVPDAVEISSVLKVSTKLSAIELS
jgi:hypothetical protein